MFARPNSQHSQIAYVTNDLDGAIKLFEEKFGAPGFFSFSNMQPGMEQSDAPQLKIALSRVGGVEIELIEPIGDTAPLFADALPGGEGLAIRFHHVAIRIDGGLENWEAHVASLDTAAHLVAFQGALGDQLRFLYTDERTTLGHYVEHVWMAPTLVDQMNAMVPTYSGR